MRSSTRPSGRSRLIRLAGGVFLAGAVGCAAGPPPFDPSSVRPYPLSGRVADAPVVRAAHQEPAAKDAPLAKDAAPPTAPPTPALEVVRVDDLVQLAVGRNPRLARAAFNIDAAQGKQVQAGLYPNPVLAVTADELGDRQGPAGIITAPQVSQEIVTGRKLSLSQAVAAREVDQAALALLRERYAVIGTVRAAFYDLYALERRVAVLDELVGLAGKATRTGQTLLENKQIARLDQVQLEVELARFRAQAEAARRELPGARARLAAVVGDPRLPVGTPAGPFDVLPNYDPERTAEVVLATHPEVRSARVGVERAQAAVRRAEVEPIPNLTLSTGYTRQNQNQSNDWLLGVSAPIPVWNRNQGNIRTARAELGAAIQDVGRAENDLAERVAVAYRTYAASLKLSELYRTTILPKAEETYQLSQEAFKGGQFEYLRVIQAQRAVAEARLESVRALGEAWRAAAELSALMLEELWPGPPPAVPGPGAGPVRLPPPQPEPPRKDGVLPR